MSVPEKPHVLILSARPAIVVPWKSDSSAPRQQALTRVASHLRKLDLPMVMGTPEGPWSPGAARNAGVRALGEAADVFAFNDADTIVPLDQIAEALQLAVSRPGLVFAYTLYVRKDANGRDERELLQSPSMGAAAISRAAFEQVGGFDPEFVGWGYEDLDFANRCAELWPLRRVEGVAWHLWHGARRGDDSPADADELEVGRNLVRLRRRAAGTVL